MVVALSSSGFITFDGKSYVGDCQTTTDILGPFYRPGAPVRNDLVIESLSGKIVHLRGDIIHDDCSTPLENAKVELWHCSAEEIYDNDSDDFNYRGTTYSSPSGKYHFRTQMPVPYDAGGGMYRPAHFHLMISAPGYQSLITQLYFTGDPYLHKDPSSRTESAKSRILSVIEDPDGSLVIPFDVVMQKKLPLDPVVIDRLVGTYQAQDDQSRTFEFFKHDNHMWLRNELFGQFLQYIGNNAFVVPGTGDWGSNKFQFDIQGDGSITVTRYRNDGKEGKQHAVKMK